jgi:uncharacterized protein (DUF305 family)
MLLVLLVASAATFFVLSKNKINQNPSTENIVQVKSEKEFLEYLIYLHSQSIKGTDELLNGEVRLRPVRELAEDVKLVQANEQTQLIIWYKDWYQEDYQGVANELVVGRGLIEVASPQREKMYLEDMIRRHLITIEFINQVLRLGIRKETKVLAESILIKQTEEVRVMKELLELQPE